MLVAFLFAFVYALILTLLFTTLFSQRRTWDQFWPFFVLTLLIAFAAGFWVIPAGPVAWGFYWLPGLLAALIFALLIAATVPRERNNKSSNVNESEEVQKNITATTYYSPHAAEPQKGKPLEDSRSEKPGIFFWLLVFSLSLLILGGILTD